MSDTTVIEDGVAVVKGGKFWGIQYADGQCTEYGYGDAKNAKIGDARYYKTPTDMIWVGSPYTKALSEGQLVKVRRITAIEIVE